MINVKNSYADKYIFVETMHFLQGQLMKKNKIRTVFI